MSKLKLYGEPGWGSVIIESQLSWYNMPFDFHEVGDLFASKDAGIELKKINPLGQIPTLVLSDGSVMTESAAITLWLADQSGNSELVPEAEAEERAQFLRWLVFITSNIYPTYTYSDVPARFVRNESAQKEFAQAVGDYAKKLYLNLDSEASGPWFLGQRFSALDIYICTLTHWRPGRQWFIENTAKLVSIADATLNLPRLSPVWLKNFPGDGK